MDISSSLELVELNSDEEELQLEEESKTEMDEEEQAFAKQLEQEFLEEDVVIDSFDSSFDFSEEPNDTFDLNYDPFQDRQT